MKILVSVFSNLATDQRVAKICNTLYKHHFQIELIGNNWQGSPLLNRPYPVHRISLHSKNLKLAYPEFNWKLYRCLKSKADHQTILYVNDLDALLPNYLVAKKLNIPLIYDSHEIYTEMPALQGRPTQKIWRFLEKRLINKINLIITASDSYADWFVNKYAIKKPEVIRNYPLKRNPNHSGEQNSTKIILYQGVINPSRGLEHLIPIIKNFENTQLWIAGDGPKKNELQELAKSSGTNHLVKFLGKISPDELQEITEQADVGVSIEENNGLSYYYSLPNKISDYIQARIPIVVSDFPEMRKVIANFPVGEVIKNHSEGELTAKLNNVLKLGKRHYFNALQDASKEMCWENEEEKLLSIITKARKLLRS